MGRPRKIRAPLSEAQRQEAHGVLREFENAGLAPALLILRDAYESEIATCERVHREVQASDAVTHKAFLAEMHKIEIRRMRERYDAFLADVLNAPKANRLESLVQKYTEIMPLANLPTDERASLPKTLRPSRNKSLLNRTQRIAEEKQRLLAEAVVAAEAAWPDRSAKDETDRLKRACNAIHLATQLAKAIKGGKLTGELCPDLVTVAQLKEAMRDPMIERIRRGKEPDAKQRDGQGSNDQEPNPEQSDGQEKRKSGKRGLRWAMAKVVERFTGEKDRDIYSAAATYTPKRASKGRRR